MINTNQVTNLIPTKNRPHFLKRTLEYYKITNFKGKIFVGDSSEDDLLITNKNLINEYSYYIDIRHFIIPNRGVFPVLEIMSKEIKSKYSFTSADDDFVITKGISKAISFLEENEEFTVVHGKGITIFLDQDGAFGNILKIIDNYPQSILLENTPSSRLKKFLLPPLAQNFGVHRTKILKKALENFTNYSWSNNVQMNLDELIFSGSVAIMGKVAEINCDYLIRQAAHSDKVLRFDAYELMQQSEWSQSLNDMHKRFAELLADEENISLIESDKKVKKAIEDYLVFNLSKNNAQHQNYKNQIKGMIRNNFFTKHTYYMLKKIVYFFQKDKKNSINEIKSSKNFKDVIQVLKLN